MDALVITRAALGEKVQERGEEKALLTDDKRKRVLCYLSPKKTP